MDGAQGCGAFDRDGGGKPPPSPRLRVAVEADGNFNDPDDWSATPATLALLARRGLQGNLVHYGYSSGLGPNVNNTYMASQMSTSTLGAADRFGFDRARFFDDQTHLSEAIDSLTSQINASSADAPLIFLAAGPMEVLWRALNKAEPDKRRSVTVISHSEWNNTKVVQPEMTHDAEDVKALGVSWVQIADQNAALFTKAEDCTEYKCSPSSPGWAPWQWLQNANQAGLRWIYERMQVEGKPDMSDAGMAYYLLTHDQHATPEKLRTFFGE